MNEVIRKTFIRKDQYCSCCGEKILKGSNVIVKASSYKRTITRLYYCLKCGYEIM